MANRDEWMQRRCGYLSASMIGDIISASGKIIDGNISAIRKKRFERRFGYSIPFTSSAMEKGTENEPYAVAWFRENHPELPIVYSQELPEIPFWTVDWAKFGASPDAYSEDGRVIVEFKTVVSATNVEFFADEYTSYEEKKLAVWKEHGAQLLAQLLTSEKAEEVWLVKHIPQFDEIMQDVDSPLASWRGLVFKFRREDFAESLAALKERIVLFDAMIDSHLNPSSFKEGIWYLDQKGTLKQKEEEKKVSGKRNTK